MSPHENRKVQLWCPDCRFTWPVPDAGEWRLTACPRCGGRFAHRGRDVGKDTEGYPLRRIPPLGHWSR